MLEFLHEHLHGVPTISALQSLVVIVVVTAASILKTRCDPEVRAHAGSLRHHEDRADTE